MRQREGVSDVAGQRVATHLARAGALCQSLSGPSWRTVWVLLALMAAAIGAAAPGELGIP